MPFISRIFYFRIISQFLNSRVSAHVFYKVYSDSLLARTLNCEATNSRILAKIKFSRIFADLQQCVPASGRYAQEYSVVSTLNLSPT